MAIYDGGAQVGYLFEDPADCAIQDSGECERYCTERYLILLRPRTMINHIHQL
jgi:hypothetical protein